MARLRIRELGEAKGYNMSSLSRASNISFNTVKRLWQNPEADAQVGTLDAIARVLKVHVSELFEPEEGEEKDK